VIKQLVGVVITNKVSIVTSSNRGMVPVAD
jgi:hypothetical protein